MTQRSRQNLDPKTTPITDEEIQELIRALLSESKNKKSILETITETAYLEWNETSDRKKFQERVSDLFDLVFYDYIRE